VDAIPWPLIGPWSGWAAFLGLALLNVRAIWVGLVVPRPTHKEALDRADHDANEWRTEGRIKDQAILVELEAIKKTTEETGKTLHAFIESIQKASGVTDESAR
jgi:hypothetical protein